MTQTNVAQQATTSQPTANQPVAKQAITKKAPVGAKIISVLYFIGAVAALVFGVLFLFGAGFITTLIQDIGVLGTIGAGIMIFLGILLILVAVLEFFIGRSLWKAHRWARIVVIIFSILGVLGAIGTLVTGAIWSGIFSLIYNGVIGGYLLFSKQVKAAFS